MGRRIKRREDAGDDSKKVLRYALQQAAVNITETPERIERPVAESAGTLAKRDNNWNWKHLEDYRGFLYFIESAFPLRSLPL